MTKQEKEEAKKELHVKWRLSNLPSVEELRDLVKDEILTKEEARNILATFEKLEVQTEEQFEEQEHLKSELNFLRDLLEQIVKNRGYVQYIPAVWWKRYEHYPYYGTYQVLCGTQATTGSLSSALTSGGSTAVNSMATTTVSLPRYK